MKNMNFAMLFVRLVLMVCVFQSISVSMAQESSEQTEAIILRLFEAFNRHDTEALVALYATDAEIMSPGDTQAQQGHDVIRSTYDSHFQNIPGVHDAVHNIVTQGNRGAIEFIASWEQPTPENSDARGQLRIASFITVENGLIVKDVTYFDRMEMQSNMQLD